ncbi:D-amino acid dehydrogenase [Sulfuracidifex tepidarius]|uniref:D-amino acid dehydrogenase n=2 Tax=Sulfuracidifex tepidarius TaxID=1294262 RepID=A0A510DRS5_9CREN|nr:D-amino acid dehydrogenase [Sulfuracidifex tepidarius]BBG25623.1 D-amino acid dehydrogenase [Sulfuracidifex tepidarius]
MKYDTVIVGAGHNGLVAAITLAKNGLKVAVIESRERAGGMADTNVWNGIRYPRSSYVLGLFPKELQDYLGVSFPTLERDRNGTFVTEEGNVIRFFKDRERRHREFTRLGQTNYPKLEEKILRLKNFMMKNGLTFTTNPPSKEKFREKLEDSGLEVFMEPTRRVLSEYLDEEFHPYFAYRFMLGEPAYLMAYFFSLEWKMVRGGTGTVGEVLSRRARELGVDFMFSTKVQRVNYDEMVRSVSTTSGEIETDSVIMTGSPVLLEGMAGIKMERPPVPGWRRYTVFTSEIKVDRLPEPVREEVCTLFTLPVGEVTIPSMCDDLGGNVITVMGDPDSAVDYLGIDEEKILHIDEMNPGKAEREYNLPSGDLNHLPMRCPYLFQRPTPSGYRTAIKGLYVGGSGAYPGGQITGIPGYNSAMTLLKDRR